MDANNHIHFTPDAAIMEFNYRGTPERGMLAWLDSEEIGTWWRASKVLIEPYPGGTFYLSWTEPGLDCKHAVYGAMSKVDAENKLIEVAKIIYVFPGGKLSNLHLSIRFEKRSETETAFHLTHLHNYKGPDLKLYHSLVREAWPKTISLLKNHLEAQ